MSIKIVELSCKVPLLIRNWFQDAKRETREDVDALSKTEPKTPVAEHMKEQAVFDSEEKALSNKGCAFSLPMLLLFIFFCELLT